MICTFEGVKGSGMTLSAVHMVFEEMKRTGKPVVADYKLGPNRHLDEEGLMRALKEKK